MFVLPEARTKELLALPESGMGFQLVEFITDDNRRHQGVAFNAEFIIRANEPCIHLLNESEVRQARVELEARMPYG